MIIQNFRVVADDNKLLKNLISGTLSSEIFLGKQSLFVNDKLEEHDITLNDILEVQSIKVGNEVYYIRVIKDYGELVTELIRLKYTLDDELALMANSRIGDDKYEMEFLNWRKLCKEAAKRVLNE